MNFLLKYWTRIILLILVFSIIIAANINFNKEYHLKRDSAANISYSNDVEVRVSSFVLKHNSREIFEADIISAAEPALIGLKAKVYLKSTEPYNLAPGDRVRLCGRWTAPKGKSNDGGFDGESYYKSLNIHGVFYANEKSERLSTGESSFTRSLSGIREKFMDSCDEFFSPRYSGIVKGLVSGETKFIDDNWSDILKKSGIYHIIAISGMHLNIFIICIAYLISKLKLKRHLKSLVSAIACISVSVVVLMFTGVGLSLMRAFVMLLVMLGANIVSRKYNAKNSLAISAAVLLIIMPESLYNAGFQLSLLSTWAVLVSADIIKRLQQNSRYDSFSKKAWFATCLTSFMCSVFNFPVMFVSFGYISIYAPITNLLVLPMSTPMLAFGVIFALSSIAGLSILAKSLTYPLYILIYLTIEAARIMVELPFSVVNLYPTITIITVSVITALCICIFLYLRYRKKAAISLLIAFSLIFTGSFIFIKADDTARLIFADVGQGDCAIVSLPGGRDIMIDCGSLNASDYLTDEIEMTLVKNDIPKLDAMIISHYDSDHVSSAIYLVAHGLCDKLYLPKYFDTSDKADMDKYRLLKAAANVSGTDICYLQKGDVLSIGDANLMVLSPYEGMAKDSNEMSMVISLCYGDTTILFTGDIEERTSKKLIGENLEADILKIPHHGGKNEHSEAFIKSVSPNYALISCGYNNPYSHPHADTIEVLEKYEVEIYRTDTMGAVQFFFDKDEVKKIKTMK